MRTALIQPSLGLAFGQHLAAVRVWCAQHEIEPVKFTYSLAIPGGPRICIEFPTDQDADAFALDFPASTRLACCPDRV
jgi:hypothetical protein